jgi:hypothetical protein
LEVGATYVIPDGHDKDHGNGEGLVQSIEATGLGEAVAVIEDAELSIAELRGDVGAVREAGPGRRGHLDLAAVLDEELREPVTLEAGDNAVLGQHPDILRRRRGGQGTYVNLRLVSTVLPLP